MIFDFFGGKKEKPQLVSDEVLTDAMQVIIPILESQIEGARAMSHTMPDGEERFQALLNGSFFYGYVFGCTERIGMERFSGLIDKQDFGKNIRRLTG